MSALATPVSPPAIVVSEGARAYVGYRRGEAATLRLPSGRYVHVRLSAERELAAAVLDDRLAAAAPAALVERFAGDWVDRRARGEFVWPVAAVDEWLAAHRTAAVELVPPPRVASVRGRVHAGAHHLHAAPYLQVGPTPSPRGGH